jgi:hypothetical protein|tara:strand:- start:2228 stop:3007 length:780 start_codon:yes stop_codon:yes gene_type:complete
MAYPKITVNTGLVRSAFASNTIPIPSPDLTTLTSTSTGVTSGIADSNVQDALVDTTTNFLLATVPLPVLIDDRAIRTTGGGAPDSSLVTATATTNLTLAADTFPDGNESYTISRPNHLIDTTETFVTKGVSVGDVVYNNVTGVVTRVSVVNNEVDLTLEDDLFSSDTTFNDTYTIFLGGQLPGPEGKSSEGCLLYVASTTTVTTSIATTYVASIRVKTVAGNNVTFLNFPIGQYLPVQITQLYSTGTTPESRAACLAIW